MVATNLEKKQQYFNLFSMTGNFGKEGGNCKFLESLRYIVCLILLN